MRNVDDNEAANEFILPSSDAENDKDVPLQLNLTCNFSRAITFYVSFVSMSRSTYLKAH